MTGRTSCSWLVCEFVSFLDSDICLQDNLILGNFSDLYIFHLEIIFFLCWVGRKTATTADFWLRVSWKGGFLLAALWIARHLVGVCWTILVNILLCCSHGLLLRLISEKNMNVVSFFYITSSVTKGTLHLNDLSEWVQPRLVKAPSQYNEHFVIAAVCPHGFTRFSVPRRFRAPHIGDLLIVRTTRVSRRPKMLPSVTFTWKLQGMEAASSVKLAPTNPKILQTDLIFPSRIGWENFRRDQNISLWWLFYEISLPFVWTNV